MEESFVVTNPFGEPIRIPNFRRGRRRKKIHCTSVFEERKESMYNKNRAVEGKRNK